MWFLLRKKASGFPILNEFPWLEKQRNVILYDLVAENESLEEQIEKLTGKAESEE